MENIVGQEREGWKVVVMDDRALDDSYDTGERVTGWRRRVRTGTRWR